MKALIIYHANCIDGFTAAWASHKALIDPQMPKRHDSIVAYPANYKEDPPWHLIDSQTDVYIVDFSYPYDPMFQVFCSAHHTVVLDHHKTAEKDLAAFVEQTKTSEMEDDAIEVRYHVYFDMNRSGAGMAWDYFHPHVARPSLIDVVEDYDLWKFKLASSKPLHEVLVLQEQTFEQWQAMMNCLENPPAFNSMVRSGELLLAAKAKQIDTILKLGTSKLRIDNDEGLICNCPPMFASDAGNLLAQRCGTFGCTWYEDATKSTNFSLRSNGDYDVSAIAKKFGGGGHKNAAGFRLANPTAAKDGTIMWSSEVFKERNLG